jgi:hypothetical protein
MGERAAREISWTITDNEGSYVLTVAEFGPESGIDHEKGDVLELDEYEARRLGEGGGRGS